MSSDAGTLSFDIYEPAYDSVMLETHAVSPDAILRPMRRQADNKQSQNARDDDKRNGILATKTTSDAEMFASELPNDPRVALEMPKGHSVKRKSLLGNRTGILSKLSFGKGMFSNLGKRIQSSRPSESEESLLQDENSVDLDSTAHPFRTSLDIAEACASRFPGMHQVTRRTPRQPNGRGKQSLGTRLVKLLSRKRSGDRENLIDENRSSPDDPTTIF